MRRWRRQKKDASEPSDHALGRSHGGFSTKIHLLCDDQGHPLACHLTGGQTHEAAALVELLVHADETVVDEHGRRVAWPRKLAGDKGYRAAWIDELLLKLGITPVIPSKKDESPKARRQRGIPFDRNAYRQRNVIERLVGRLKECRRILTRFEKTARNYHAMLTLAFIRYYLMLGAKAF